jgi:hypothetical protein
MALALPVSSMRRLRQPVTAAAARNFTCNELQAEKSPVKEFVEQTVGGLHGPPTWCK